MLTLPVLPISFNFKSRVCCLLSHRPYWILSSITFSFPSLLVISLSNNFLASLSFSATVFLSTCSLCISPLYVFLSYSFTFSRSFCYDDGFFSSCRAKSILLCLPWILLCLLFFFFMVLLTTPFFLWHRSERRLTLLRWCCSCKKQPPPLMHLIGCETSLLESNLQTAFPSRPLLHVDANQALQVFKHHHYEHYVLQMTKFHGYSCHSTFFDFPCSGTKWNFLWFTNNGRNPMLVLFVVELLVLAH